MILYSIEDQKVIDKNYYLFQDNFNFLKFLSTNKLFFTEENIVDIINTKLSDTMADKIFVDIGANVGLYTLTLANKFKHTYSFEPVLDTYNILCGNIAIHSLSNCTTLINKGLYNECRIMKQHFYDILGSLTHLSVDETDEINENTKREGYTDDVSEIEVKTLDSYNITNIGLIKIDTEGTELQVLQGAEQTIKNSNYPMLVVESWEENDKDTEEYKEYKRSLRNELFDYIKGLGYAIENTPNPEVFICEHNVQQPERKKVKNIFY